ncbi:YihY/virulence factor BrkB family protein [Nocardia sp. NPDC051321]|uniref:YihY/virulence factor BrkB family protein n=1 Tax=Nocardia sp. NPDC051321 TaxID=3364323 RepID=UPI0037943F42
MRDAVVTMTDENATPSEPLRTDIPSLSGGIAARELTVGQRWTIRLRRARRNTTKLVVRVAVKAWNDSIFAKSAAAAFWQTLSLAPLLLGVLGSLGYVGTWFGPDTVQIVESKIISFSRDLFSSSVVTDLIEPTVKDVLGKGRGAVVSVGFVLSLWAGSSAMATFVDSIVEAHDQQDLRHPVWQRIFALLLYVAFLVASVFILPLVALGPTLIGRVLPEPWRVTGLQLLDFFYYPGVGLLLIIVLTTLYKLALHTSLPWHRLFGGALVAAVFFITASEVLRRYLAWVTKTGVSYGALATPIAFLLFTYFLGFAVILGAEFNAAVQEFWPARATRMEQMKEWLTNQLTGDSSDKDDSTTETTETAEKSPPSPVDAPDQPHAAPSQPPPAQPQSPFFSPS